MSEIIQILLSHCPQYGYLQVMIFSRALGDDIGLQASSYVKLPVSMEMT